MLKVDDPVLALGLFYKYYDDLELDDPEVVKRSIQISKRQKDEIESRDIIAFSDERMWPHRILKERLKTMELEMEYGTGPEIFMPYYDSQWSLQVKNVLKDFGVKASSLFVDKMDYYPFLSKGSVKKLSAEIYDRVKESNGVVIPGNTQNVNKKLYGEGTVNPISERRSFIEMATLKAALELKKPIWAICGGLQVSAVALGGKLAQAYPSHFFYGSAKDLATVEADSFLHLARHSKNKNRGDEYLHHTKTFSSHREYVDDTDRSAMPLGLKQIATSYGSGRIPKAFEAKEDGSTFLYATQCHLEYSPRGPIERNAIGAFVQDCRDDLVRTREEEPDLAKPSGSLRAKMAARVAETIKDKFKTLF